MYDCAICVVVIGRWCVFCNTVQESRSVYLLNSFIWWDEYNITVAKVLLELHSAHCVQKI